MAYRLVVMIEGKRQRFALAPGEHEIGSGHDAALRIAHPTVSRHHAMLLVGDDAVSIRDLGSHNGIRIGMRRIEEATLVPDEPLFIGGVPARLEEVAASDLEPAVVIDPTRSGAAARAERSTDQTTCVASIMEDFSVLHLPALLARLEEGVSGEEMCRLVGEALFTVTPSTLVRISTAAGGVVFEAEREARGGEEALHEPAGAFALLVRLPTRQLAAISRPVVRLAAQVVRLASRRETPAPPRAAAPANAPLLPDPPTVVPRVREIYSSAAVVARGDVGALILGESGTGKEVLARYLHNASPRADGPFLGLNCASLPADLLEAELFGIERGVATGVEARPGKFELADGGTLFLDEVGDMSLETQAKILRVLQSGEVFRLGGRAARQISVRIVSATNRDITALMAAGSFREDLYHRIATWVVELPPLRRRRADIANLAAHFAAVAARHNGVRVAGISRAAIELLVAYPWPGNIRQLENEMARAVLFLEDGELLDTGCLAEQIREQTVREPGRGLAAILEQVECDEIQLAIAAAGGNITAAARRLGFSRSTLYRRMRDLGLETPAETPTT